MVGSGISTVQRQRHRRLSAVTIAALLLGMFAVSVEVPVAATVSGSFNALDGELDTSGGTRSVTAVADQPSGSTDNSYAGGGPKEDDVCPQVAEDHAAPPKADLTRFWHGSDPGAPGVLYLAWERKTTTGTLTIDFELNQSTSDCGNGANPVRTPGDYLVTYDFQGGTSIAIEVREWLGSAWSSVIPLDDADYDAGISADESFGELEVDLLAAGILEDGPSSPCKSLASGFAKTRTGGGGAFSTSTVKDFIVPAQTSISNCGSLTIVKDAQPGGLPDDFSFDATGADLADFVLDDDADATLADTRTFVAHPGDKSVEERSTTGWDLGSVTCAGAGSDKVDVTDAKVEVDLGIGDNITCTYVNTKPGTITITKDARPDNGRDFGFTSNEFAAFALDDDADDTLDDSISFSDVDPGSYRFTESAAAGWTLEDIDCGDHDAAVDLDKRTVTFDIARGESVSCTFVNDKIDPEITVIKTATPLSVAEPGADVTFAVSITNDSPLPVTVTDISDSVFEDVTESAPANPLVVSTTCATGAEVDPGKTYSCRFAAPVTGNAGDVHENVITGTAVDDDGEPVDDTDDATVGITDVLPEIDVTKTADKTMIHAGDPVTYTYVVKNPGVEPLAVTMVDDKCSPVVLRSGDTSNAGFLDASETWTYTCTPSPALQVTTTNVVTAAGTDDEGNVVRDTATATVAVITPAIAIDKSVDAASVAPGTTVTYTFRVTNPGTVPLAGVVVSDDKCAPVVFDGGDANGDGLLQPSETWMFSCAQVQTGDAALTTNIGTALGRDPLGLVVSATDSVRIAVVAPAVFERPSPAPVVAPVEAATLPRTGTEVGGLVQLAAALVLLGLALVFTSRRHRTARA